MKRIATLLITALAVLCTVSCSESFKDIKVTSCQLESITPRGLSAFDAILDIGINNPAPQVTLSEMNAVIRLNEIPCLYLTAEDITLEPRSEQVYVAFFHGSLAEDFNPFSLLPLLQHPELEGITLDLGFRGTLRSGLGKYFEYTGIPIKDIMGKI